MAYTLKSINDMYRRVLAALPIEFADLPAGSAGVEAADGLSAAFALVEEKSGAQAGFDGTAQAGTAQRAVDRLNLYNFRRSLAQTARNIARKKPGFNENYPSPSDENDTQLLTNSRAVAPKALADQADFIRSGLTKEFVVSGADLVAAFETSFGMTDGALASRGAAVGSKKEAQEDAADFFDDLSTYIRNHYRSQPNKLAAWKIASHIERSPKKTPVVPKP